VGFLLGGDATTGGLFGLLAGSFGDVVYTGALVVTDDLGQMADGNKGLTAEEAVGERHELRDHAADGLRGGRLVVFGVDKIGCVGGNDVLILPAVAAGVLLEDVAGLRDYGAHRSHGYGK